MNKSDNIVILCVAIMLTVLFTAAIASAYAHTPEYTINKLTGEKNQIITQFYTHINDSSSYLSTTPVFDVNQLCEAQYNHSNFTSNVWGKYCVDPQTDADYNGTNLDR